MVPTQAWALALLKPPAPQMMSHGAAQEMPPALPISHLAASQVLLSQTLLPQPS